MRYPRGRWALLTALFVSAGISANAAAPAQTKPEPCETCHGAGGNSVIPGTPSISGQPQVFLETQLILFREGLRRSPVMEPLVRGMKDPQIIALAKHFAAQPAKKMAASPMDHGLAQDGRGLAKKLHCGSCHVPDFSGQKQVPRLAGQREEYLLSEMLAYRDGKRTGGDTIMSSVLYGVSDAEIRALAHFLAHLEPSSRARR